MVFACFGILLAYVTGAYMTYSTSPYVMMIFPIALFVSFVFLPGSLLHFSYITQLYILFSFEDTPMSLMSRNKTEAAEKSLRFYKSCSDISQKDTNERFEAEVAKLHLTVKMNKERGEKLQWKDFSKLYNNISSFKYCRFALL